MDYYIVYLENIPIGVTGIYSYNEYPENAWLGWFGILKEYRNNGYGGIVLDKTIELAKKRDIQNSDSILMSMQNLLINYTHLEVLLKNFTIMKMIKMNILLQMCIFILLV